VSYRESGENAETRKREKAKMRKAEMEKQKPRISRISRMGIEGARTEGRNQKPHAKDAKVAKDQSSQ